jgi:SHS2 domain-containing protein
VDLDDLLVRWLGELLFQADTRRLVPQAITFQQLDGQRLRAECIMSRAGTPGCEIKAVTYHQSGIRDSGGRLEATLLLDV